MLGTTYELWGIVTIAADCGVRVDQYSRARNFTMISIASADRTALRRSLLRDDRSRLFFNLGVSYVAPRVRRESWYSKRSDGHLQASVSGAAQASWVHLCQLGDGSHNGRHVVADVADVTFRGQDVTASCKRPETTSDVDETLEALSNASVAAIYLRLHPFMLRNVYRRPVYPVGRLK